jgi:hypothetical protein
VSSYIHFVHRTFTAVGSTEGANQKIHFGRFLIVFKELCITQRVLIVLTEKYARIDGLIHAQFYKCVRLNYEGQRKINGYLWLYDTYHNTPKSVFPKYWYELSLRDEFLPQSGPIAQPSRIKVFRKSISLVEHGLGRQF